MNLSSMRRGKMARRAFGNDCFDLLAAYTCYLRDVGTNRYMENNASEDRHWRPKLTSAHCPMHTFTNISRTEVPDSTCIAACSFALAKRIDGQPWCCDFPYGRLFAYPYLPELFTVMFGQPEKQQVFRQAYACSEAPPNPENYLKRRSVVHLWLDVYAALGLFWVAFLAKVSVAVGVSLGTH